METNDILIDESSEKKEDNDNITEIINDNEKAEETSSIHEDEVIDNPDGNIFPNTDFGAFTAMADLINNSNKNATLSESYSAFFNTTLDLFKNNDSDHERYNQSLSFLAENIDNLISQLNKYKKNAEIKIRFLFFMNLVTWIVLLVKVL